MDVVFPPLLRRQASAPNATAVPVTDTWAADSNNPFGNSGDWLNGTLGDITLPGLTDVLTPSTDTPFREVHIICLS